MNRSKDCSGSFPTSATMPRITETERGAYTWQYELNLFRNPSVLFVVWKIFFFVSLAIWLFVTWISIGDRNFWWTGFLSIAKVFALGLGGIFAFTLLGYLVYACMMGGKYRVVFHMDEEGITHTQLPKQSRKAKRMATLTTVVGLATNRPSTAGAGMLAGSKTSSHSDWDKVKRVRSYPSRHLIKVDSLLNHNQIYAHPEDFAFVESYILSHTAHARRK